MPTTVYNSFARNLDPVPQTGEQGFYRTISSSSASTMIIDAPYAYFPQSYTDLTALAKQRLPHVAKQTCVDQNMPQLERTHILHTEADVVRASMLYLVHPVNVVASSLLGSNKTLYCRSEIQGTGLRTDIRWMVRSSQGQRDVAVLEFKNTKVLHAQDFRDAAATPANAKSKRSDAMGNDNSTLFAKNGEVISKQAKKYSQNVAPDVAVFDWRTMFVFDFTDVDEDASNPKFCRGTWFAESTQTQNQKDTFRMVLLGFLIRALMRYNYVS